MARSLSCGILTSTSCKASWCRPSSTTAGCLVRAPVRGDEGAVQDQVGKPLLNGLFQGTRAAWVPWRRGLRRPRPYSGRRWPGRSRRPGPAGDVRPVPEPRQDEHCLLPAGQGTRPVPGAELTAVSRQQRGHEHRQWLAPRRWPRWMPCLRSPSAYCFRATATPSPKASPKRSDEPKPPAVRNPPNSGTARRRARPGASDPVGTRPAPTRVPAHPVGSRHIACVHPRRRIFRWRPAPVTKTARS